MRSCFGVDDIAEIDNWSSSEVSRSRRASVSRKPRLNSSKLSLLASENRRREASSVEAVAASNAGSKTIKTATMLSPKLVLCAIERLIRQLGTKRHTHRRVRNRGIISAREQR